MNGNPATPLIREITLRNFLSFGQDVEPLQLLPLNVLIGPNGSGKSNLIEAFSVLRSTTVPTETKGSDLRTVLQKGGGVQEWIWKGAPKQSASLDLVINLPHKVQPVRHVVKFKVINKAFQLDDERIENEEPSQGETDPFFFYRFQQGHPVILTSGERRILKREQVELNSSILYQRRDPDNYPEITTLAENYERFRLYREWSFGRSTVFREPQRSDMRNDRLEEDFSNLGLVLNRLRKNPQTKRMILKHLDELYEGLTDVDVIIEGGSVQVFFTEGDFYVPATRLSDGTLRYLCLLAILCDPEPPPIICLEEPELGLHPDILPTVADLLVSASERTQLIVTTHSDIIVDALTERPESIVVCERRAGQTHLRRLEAGHLTDWLAKYRLGQLWTKGELGGVRWGG